MLITLSQSVHQVRSAGAYEVMAEQTGGPLAETPQASRGENPLRPGSVRTNEGATTPGNDVGNQEFGQSQHLTSFQKLFLPVELLK